MHGPSSSHTAASYRIGFLVRALLGGEPASARFVFDRDGSYGQVFREQGSDLGFVTGLLGWSMTDERFFRALDEARAKGVGIAFEVARLPGEEHPNAVEIQAVSRDGSDLTVLARSLGGGAVELVRLNGWAVNITGEEHDVLAIVKEGIDPDVLDPLAGPEGTVIDINRVIKDGLLLVHVKRRSPLREDVLESLWGRSGVIRIMTVPPILFVPHGNPIFNSGREMLALAEKRELSLGRLALAYEAELLCLSREEILAEMGRRLDIMTRAVSLGLDTGRDLRTMRLLEPSAHRIMKAEASHGLALGGPHTRAAARAMAVMHVNAGMGLVCAAPTGGSAGVIPGVILTLIEELGLGREEAILALLAASAVGLVVLMRGDTFAAEVAGCQVEIGAAGAMAAAAVVEAAGGSASLATDAASIALQNTMGSVCDLVQGLVEIPCHTRNAVAASSAFVCADLVLGGYVDPIGLDDSVDASLEVGRALRPEYRCTARGGLAITPSALALKGGTA